ncbi:glycine, alanine and asparagine-rich protein-like [Helianthus annuus]|uniref:glycine, alanine and asparagine-rich protein-like n=1 Tax=Helianthus annuus TaxID=4232 RepID=UPI000B905DA9|nr:glycine, alanine and asparagine-rich protein-like [Helianthus annuus]
MPPRRNNQLSTTEAELQERISQAIAQHEALRSKHGGGTSGNNPPNGCTYKQFLDCKPLNFDGTGDGALSWWNLQVQTLGEAAAYAFSWDELKELMQKKFGKCETCGKVGHSNKTCWYGTGRGNGGQGGNGNGNGNRGGNVYGNRNQGGNNNQGGNGNRNGNGNQAGNGNRRGNNNNNQGGAGNGRGQGCFGCGDVGHFKRDFPKNN